MNAHSSLITWPITRIQLMRVWVIFLTAAIALSLPSTAAAVTSTGARTRYAEVATMLAMPVPKFLTALVTANAST